MQHVSDLHLKFALGHSMCGSVADIQSATAEIRGGKKRRKKERRKKSQGKNLMAAIKNNEKDPNEDPVLRCVQTRPVVAFLHVICCFLRRIIT